MNLSAHIQAFRAIDLQQVSTRDPTIVDVAHKYALITRRSACSTPCVDFAAEIIATHVRRCRMYERRQRDHHRHHHISSTHNLPSELRLFDSKHAQRPRHGESVEGGGLKVAYQDV